MSTPNKIEELRKTNPVMYTLGIFDPTEKLHEFIVRPPRRDEIDRAIQSPNPMTSNQNLLVGCLLSPTFVESAALFDEFPGFLVELAREVSKLSGLGATVSVKKL